MVSIETFRTLALSFGGTTELPHFEKTAFRANKKIFATLSESNRIACLKLSAIDQSVFCAFDKAIIHPVPNKWGQQGWTNFVLDNIEEEMMEDALNQAYQVVTSRKKKL